MSPVLTEENVLTAVGVEALREDRSVAARKLVAAEVARTVSNDNLEPEQLAAALQVVECLVEDIAGYAILINIENHDQIRALLEPLPITTFVNYQIIPLGTLEGHSRHIRDLGLKDPFRELPASGS